MAVIRAGHAVTGRVARTPLAVAMVATGCAIAVMVALSDRAAGDYVTHGPVVADNAAPALVALAHGKLAAFVANQPAMGLTSLILRAPVVWAVRLLGGSDLLAYRLGAAACLLPLGLLGAWLIARRGAAPSRRRAGATAAALLLLSPAVRAAVSAGHPEDVLAAVLDTGAVLAAMRGRPGWGAVMLALAIGSKPWAVIGVVPLLLATPHAQRLATGVRTAALTVLLVLALPIANPSAAGHVSGSIGQTHLVNPFSVLWPLSHPVLLPDGRLAESRWLPLGLTRSSASLATLALSALAMGLVWARSWRAMRRCDALALLALLGLLRCLCDTTQLEYYRVAVLIPLVVWEAVGIGRPPLVGALATAAVALMPTAVGHLTPFAINVVYVGLTLILLVYLSGQAVGRGRVSIKAPSAIVDT